MLRESPGVDLSNDTGSILATIPVFLGLQDVLVALEDPDGVASRGIQEQSTCNVGQGITEGRCFFVFLVRDELLVVFWFLELVDQAVIECLVGLLVGNPEPSSIKFTFLSNGPAILALELTDRQQDHGSRLLNLVEVDLNLLVIVDLEHAVPEVIIVAHEELLAAPALVIDSGNDFALSTDHDGLWIVLTLRSFVERIVSSREGKSVETARQITVKERHVSVDDGVALALVELLTGESFGIACEFLLLVGLDLGQGSIQKASVFARKRTDFGRQIR